MNCKFQDFPENQNNLKIKVVSGRKLKKELEHLQKVKVLLEAEKNLRKMISNYCQC
jgi:hypothetical protein